jgi:hypothetical protein
MGRGARELPVKSIQELQRMRILRNVLVTLLLASAVGGCIVVARPRPWHPCCRCY